MITKQMLIEAIAECQGEREPNANTCYKLAAYYTILNELFGESEQLPVKQGYSADSNSDTVQYESDSEFGKAINGMDSGKAWALVDELVGTLYVVNKPLYSALMRRINE